MNLHKVFLLCLSCATLLFAGCNKGGDVFLNNGSLFPVTLKGFNGSSQILEATIDTFDLSLINANATFNVGQPFFFSDTRDTATLRVYERATGKKVLDTLLRKQDKTFLMNFSYMDGKVGEMPEKPEAQDGKVRITWLFRPTITNYTEPVDIAIGKFYFTPKVFEEVIRIKNVKPNEFSEVITFPAPLYTSPVVYNGQNTAILLRAYIYKAGTNEFYTQGTGYAWDASSTIPVPSASVASSKLYIFSEAFTGTAVRFNKQLEL